MKKYLLGVASAVFLISASSANAAFILTLDDSSTLGVDHTFTDTDFDGLITTGAVATPTFLVNITTGLSKPLIGWPGDLIHLDSVNVSGGAGTLTISLTDTDYIRGGADFLNWNVGGTTNGSISAAAYMDAGNVEFGQGTLLGSMTSGAGAFSYTSPGTVLTGSDPYSLTLVTTINHTTPGSTSFDSAVIPEPSMIALMSLGFIGLGLAGRRKQSK